jgi:hypothetical protein
MQLKGGKRVVARILLTQADPKAIAWFLSKDSVPSGFQKENSQATP